MKILELVHEWLDDNGYCEGHKIRWNLFDRLFINNVANFYDDGNGDIAVYGGLVARNHQFEHAICLNISDPEFFTRLRDFMDSCGTFDQRKNKSSESSYYFHRD